MKDKHKKLMRYITRYVQQNGYPPSTREIAEGTGYKSTASVHVYLKEMREAGLINYVDGCPRTISII